MCLRHAIHCGNKKKQKKSETDHSVYTLESRSFRELQRRRALCVFVTPKVAVGRGAASEHEGTKRRRGVILRFFREIVKILYITGDAQCVAKHRAHRATCKLKRWKAVDSARRGDAY